MNRSFEKSYPLWFLLPAGVIYAVLFLLPTVMSLVFSMTRWTLTEANFTGLDNFLMFFSEPSLNIGLWNTLIYALITSTLKVVVGFALAVLLTSPLRSRNLLRAFIFFPTLISTIAVGITFSSLLHPTKGAINQGLAWLGIEGPNWLGDPRWALVSVALVDVWKGVGIALVIFVAGILAIPSTYYEALAIDGGNGRHKLVFLTIPLSWPATSAVILLSFIGGLRTFDLVWSMTGGGPGFATDVVASIIYKQYQAGFYGLATAGNVILVLLVLALALPLQKLLSLREVDL
jgi:raffinose/stachyose/melibiose transport system permease protein